MMREKILSAYESVYGAAPRFLVRAPGRANLIGEHTDYNDGFVMPLAVDRAVWIAFSPSPDAQIRVHSLDFGGASTAFSHEQLRDEALPHWSRHIRGAYWLLAQKGEHVPAASILIGGDVPMGAGMSSSAAIGVAAVEMALALLGKGLPQTQKALWAVEIEHQFMGVPCGVMDQMVSAAASDQSAMLLDCRSLEITPVKIPSGVAVVVMNTMKQRELANSAYAQRRQECESAAALLGLRALRDATLADLDANRDALGDVRYRRARHVVTENARALAMVNALEKNDLAEAGRLLNASHASLRDDYEVSVAELDVMSELARQHPACYGARMMGGGFGGSAIALVDAAQVEPFIAAVAPAYQTQTGLIPEFYVCQPVAGSSVESFG